MPNLFLIDGVPGSGKSELISHCSKEWNSIFFKKYTTKETDTDGLIRADLSYIDEISFEQMRKKDDFIYSYPKYSEKPIKYLIPKAELDATLKEYENVFLIVRSSDVIKAIKTVYSKYININITSIFVYCDNEKLKQRARKQLLNANPDIDNDVLEKKLSIRLNRNKECLESYNISLQKDEKIYDYVIINDLDQRKYYDCIDRIVNKEIELSRHFNDLTAFVIMPMPGKHEAAHFDNVKEAIYSGAQKAGFTALRLDDTFANQQPIFNQIKEYIEKSTVCIVDLTNNRPNCYFEADLAYKKHPANIPTTFLITEQGSIVEFDLNGNERKEYTYSLRDYSNVSRIIESLLNKFKIEHVFGVK